MVGPFVQSSGMLEALGVGLSTLAQWVAVIWLLDCTLLLLLPIYLTWHKAQGFTLF
jgi:hypothetical protein